MKTKRGMTLFEIIIAIAILGIISVSFISAISNNLSMMVKTKDITEKLFDTQETVEDKMEKLREKMWRAGKQYKKDEITIFGTTEYKVKSDFISGSNFDSTKFTINKPLPTTEYLTIGNMFGVYDLNITGLLVNGKSGRTDINTVVAYGKIEFKMPIVTNIKSEFIGGDTLKNTFYKDSLYAKGEVTIDPKTMDVWMKDVYSWYVSKDGFNVVMPDNPNNILEIEKGVHYPIFPNDFELIPGANNQTLSNLDKYKGKYLIFTATPASKVGKLADMSVAEPIYIRKFDKNKVNPVIYEDYSQINGVFSQIDGKLKEVYNNYNLVKFTLNSDDGRKTSIKAIKDFKKMERIYSDRTVYVVGIVDNNIKLEIFDNTNESNWKSFSMISSLSTGDYYGNKYYNITIGKSGVYLAEVIICPPLDEVSKTYVVEYLKDKYLIK